MHPQSITFEARFTDAVIPKSVVRQQIGITPNMRAGAQTCYRLNVLTEDVKRLGLVDYSYDPAM